LRQFRVDLHAAEPPPPPPRAASSGPWRGAVDPIGHPFRFGADGAIGPWHFDFDYEGRWLLTASRNGLLHAWKLDGSGGVEVLPPALVRGTTPDVVESVLGVAGGFAVIARDRQQSPDTELAVLHYDLVKRLCAVRLLAPKRGPLSWSYAAQYH